MAQQEQIKLKVGDRIRILEENYCYTDANVGDIEEVTFINRKHGSFMVDNGWTFFLQDLGSGFEIIGKEPTYIEPPLVKIPVETTFEENSLDGHYDFFYELTPWEAQFFQVKLDPYKVSSVWKLGERDNSGCLFHILKTIARFGDKNEREREIRAIHATIKRMAELEGLELDE